MQIAACHDGPGKIVLREVCGTQLGRAHFSALEIACRCLHRREDRVAQFRRYETAIIHPRKKQIAFAHIRFCETAIVQDGTVEIRRVQICVRKIARGHPDFV